MKANKPLREAILRAPESTQENLQPQQENLYHLGNVPNKAEVGSNVHQDLINEKPRNCMESLHNLRELEYDVEKIKSNKK